MSKAAFNNAMIKTGLKNSILDVSGLSVGQAHDVNIKTGVTVLIPDAPARCSVDVRGGGPGTREIMALSEGGLIEHVHGIVLSGGSVYGLAAADAVTTWLGAQGRGYNAYDDVPVSPVVPSAILFDNANGGDKKWGMTPPFRALALSACSAMCGHLSEGPYGAGFGARAGVYPGGLGTASEVIEGVTVAALIAANPVGSPFMPGTNCPWAWPYEVDGEFGGCHPPAGYTLSASKDTKLPGLNAAGQSTVIGVVATTAPLGKSELKRLAIMAHDGIAMAVQPSHTPLDGDTLFALSTADTLNDTAIYGPAAVSALGAAAARCVARALTRGVIQAAPKL